MIMSNNKGDNNNNNGITMVMMKKGPWSATEDGVLIEYVRKHGEGNWNAVQRNTGLQRCGKSCRLRWANHLRPNLKKGAFSLHEERLIIDLHSKLGNKWARISAHLPGRTDNEIKNYWNTRVKRRIRQGLPLYPNDHPLSTPPPPPPPLQPPLLPLSLPKPPPQPPTLTLFNSISIPATLFSLHHHHPPPFFPPHDHPLKHCSHNSFMGGDPTFSPPQMGSFRIGFGSDPGPKLDSDSFGFGCTSFELPSNQYNQNVASNFMELQDEMKANANVKNVGRVNSGLLDDLLQEAQVKVGLKREREEDCSFQWDVSSSENSCTGIKDQSEEQELNLDSQEIPNILDLIPSLVQVPKWCNDGGAESSAPQSSTVSTEDNCNPLDDQMPKPQSFDAVNATDYDALDGDWNPTGCYSWDNLPRM